jgi:hypothetical protein
LYPTREDFKEYEVPTPESPNSPLSQLKSRLKYNSMLNIIRIASSDSSMSGNSSN